MAKSPSTTLTTIRAPATYSTAEREFGLLLKQRLDELLRGKRNRLELLRKYPNDAGRLGVIATPEACAVDRLRLHTLEQLTLDVLRFLQADAQGGPIAQILDADGGLSEVQTFPTRYPHIVIERVDRFGEGLEPISITWCLYRLQDQRVEPRFNRLLGAANLLFEFVRLVN
ncbi:MAG: hypothetical protein JO352_26140 [Chloroflexi bacterium]|nr:hypothetical protein [Chloroflexota bacterium]MBV9603406.1 hypothetical protein [Chloroflexota bacterium]